MATGSFIDLKFGFRHANYFGFDDVSVVVRALPVPGDANGDGHVDQIDAAALATNWGETEDVTWQMGDFDRNGVVGAADASILAANWGYVPGEATPVPEPSTLVLLGMATVGLAVGGLCGRRRRE